MANIHILALDATRKGGAGVYTWKLIEELAGRGHDVSLICHEVADEVRQYARVHELPRINASRPFGMWRFSSFLQLNDYKRMLRQLKLSAPDVVIGSAQPMAVPYQSLYPQCPMIYLPHSLIAPVELASYGYATPLQRRVAVASYRYLERSCLRRAKATIRFTRSACEAFRDYYGDGACRNMLALPMPVKLGEHRAARQRGPQTRLLSIGRLIASKNLSFLLRTLAGLRDKAWTLDIVGDGAEKQRLIDYAYESGLHERVTFHGHVDDVAPFYQAADLFVFPSKLENSPVVLLEAMSHGLPSLSFYPDNKDFLGANHEIVAHGETGFLARGEREFAQQLAAILDGGPNGEPNGAADLQAMGDAAWSKVRDSHQWAQHVEHIEKTIERVLA